MRMGSLIGLIKSGLAIGLLCGGWAWAQKKADWQNPQVTGIHKMAARSSFFSYENHNLALKAKPGFSRFYQPLNGHWKFYWAEKLHAREDYFYRTTFDDFSWDSIAVPANWEMHHYGIPFYLNNRYEFARPDTAPTAVPVATNQVGQYRKYFHIPRSWSGRSVWLTFGSVSSAFYLWVNGLKVGYSQGSKLPATFDISEYVQPGRNVLAVEVYRWSDGSLLECHDSWRLSGIEREVYLEARPRVHISDISVRAGLDVQQQLGKLEVEVTLTNELSKAIQQYWLEAELIDPDGWNVIDFATNQMFRLESKSQSAVVFAESLPAPMPWTAETPHLYTLLLTLRNEAGEVLEVVPVKIGFRNVEVHNGKLLLNGKPLSLRGVNYQEHDPHTGHVLTEAALRKDLSLMKQHNINAIRTKGHPQSELFYELCDQYGFYVIDEANIESEGIPFASDQTLGNKPQWQQAHLDRLRRMVERDKNHPSVIAWSMGTDAGNGVNFYRMYEWLKGYDPSRPVLYEQAGLEWNTDVVFLQHPALEELDEIGEKTNGRPVVLAECGYNWGNALGGLDPFWDSLMAKPVVQGGFLGPWKDEALMLDVNTLDSVLLYGGDIGPDSLPHDSNFCLKGLVSSAQVPHPALKEVKHLFQPVKVAALNVKKGRIRIENRYDFRPLSHLALYWQVLANGVARQSGTVLNLQLEPGAADTLEIPIAPFSPQAGQEYVLDLSFQLKQEDGLLPQGHEVARAQFILRERYKPEVVETKGLPELLVRKQKRTWIISTDEFSLTFDRDKGTITSYRYKGDELLQQGFAPFFWRAMTDMDRASGYAAEAQMWEDAHQRMYVRKACLEKVHDALIRIGVEYLVPPHNVRCRLIYAIFGSGDVVLDYRLDFEKVKNPLPAIPRIGMHLQMAPDYEFVKWYGRGPHESYSNRKAGAQLGIFTQHAATVRAPYLRPQAFGCKTDVRWLSLTNNSGKGLLISGMPLVSFTANAYPLESHWDNYRHNWELPLQDAIHLYIDLAQMGVGGMQPGRPVDKQWLLPANQPYRYHFRITPVDVMREVEELSVQDFEKDWMPGIKMED